MTGFDQDAFFAPLRAGLLGPRFEQSEIDGCVAILAAMADTPLSHCAYALATAFHETARTMLPVREAYWLSEAWRKRNLRYWPWYGRGYVQITWQANYRKLDAEAAKAGFTGPGEILAAPDLAMRPDLAAFAMRRGMEEGWFGGDGPGGRSRHTLQRHLPDRLGRQAQFEQARRIINLMDKAHPIALHALQFQEALIAGNWP